MDYNLLKTFSKVAELGSFTKAAKVLNQPKSRVSRAIARLENELNIQLIRRTTRKTSLTNSGQELYQNIYPLLLGINNELVKVSDQQQEMSGVIRLTGAQDMGQTLLPQIISAFNIKHPNVQFEILITNEFLDLTKENIDIAFRAGKMQDSGLIQKKIISAHFNIFCSQKYLEKYGRPSTPKDLMNHKFLSFKELEKELFHKDIQIKPFVTSDSIPMLISMALNHEGITILPDFSCKEYLDAKTLVKIIPSWQGKTGGIHILYPPSKNISQKVKAFIKIANDLFSEK